MVTVYYFGKYDIATDQILRSKRPATLEAIEPSGVTASGRVAYAQSVPSCVIPGAVRALSRWIGFD